MKIFMLVDDSPVIRKVASRILTDLGFVVVEAKDGYDALEKCRYNMPDIVMVDWDMPAMDGIEFIEEVKKIDVDKKAKILYCTSEILIPEMTRAKRSGADGYLMKPFNRSLIVQKLQEVGMYEERDAA